MATGGCAPEIMGYSPVAAVSNLLRQRGTTIADYDLVELHEAFAAQYLACEKALGQTGLATVPSPQRCESPPPLLCHRCAIPTCSRAHPRAHQRQWQRHRAGPSRRQQRQPYAGFSCISPSFGLCVAHHFIASLSRPKYYFLFPPEVVFLWPCPPPKAPDSMPCFYRELSPDKI